MNEAKKTTSGSPAKLFFWMIAFLGVLTWLQYGADVKPAKTPTPTVERSAPSQAAPLSTPAAVGTGAGRPDAIDVVIARQRRERETLSKALEKVAKGDPRGDELIAFHREHAYYSMLVGGGVTQALFENQEEMKRAEGPFTFEVTIASREERAQNGLHVPSAFSWDSKRNELFLPDPATISDLWAGALFAHELSHAHDIVTGGEPRGLPTHDPRFLTGELLAYEMEIRLVDRAMKGLYHEAVSDLLRQLAPRVGAAAWISLDLAETGVKQRDAIFPPARSKEEQSARFGTTYMALNFAHIDARGGTKHDKLRFIASTFGIPDLP